ncbi:hypothetical protein [uncultured Winogradskyella sp.]|uniref:hypothetical protein n=1 Tax=uncultured Winogradskyella sp. TaxID=395353 RepID=UPI002638A1AF|nr:hypothetical protein [uncultured Winogradskyella sp.]
MNHIITNTYNIDSEIQEIQTALYNELVSVWDSSEIDGYGRVYKNNRDGKYIPEVYKSDVKQYKDVRYNNRSCYFFIDGDRHTSEDQIVFQAPLKIVFMLNLKDIKTITERADADVKRDAEVFLRRYKGIFDIDGYEKTIEKVFQGFEFDSIKKTENDMQPLHVFALTGTLNYYITEKC